MNACQAPPADLFEDVHRFVTARIDSETTPAEFARFDALLTESATARRLYVEYIYETLALPALLGVHEGSPSAAEVQEAAVPDPEPPALPIIIRVSPPIRYSIFSLQSPVGSVLFSCAVATLVLGLALLGAWSYKIPRDGQAATSPPRSSPAVVAHEEPEAPVGEITGLADCRWADPQVAPATRSVARGGKYALASGLMEITYESGAKVILEGPCTYEVDSPTGGFLSVGKLTARVESAKPQAANPKSQIPNQQIPNPLFVVSTPTAVVTDLGTEFGVEVGSDGSTSSHVFLGRVAMAAVGAGGEKHHRQVVLQAEQSGRVERTAEGSDPAVVVNRGPSRPESFVRIMPASNGRRAENLPPLPVVRGLALWLAADVGVIRDGQSRVHVWPDLLVGDNRTAEDARQALDNYRPRWIPDAIAGKPAVRFDSETTYLTTTLLETTAEQTLFVVFALRGERHNPHDHVMQLFNGNGPPNLVLEIVDNGGLRGRVYPGSPPPGKDDESVGLVSCREFAGPGPVVVSYGYSPHRNQASLRIDGRTVAQATAPLPAGAASQKWIGSHPTDGHHFAGDIAELLVYNAGLSEEETARVEAYLGTKYGIPLSPPPVAKEAKQAK